MTFVNQSTRPAAVVIEPMPMLADTVADVLRNHGYEVAVAATHEGGAAAAVGRRVMMTVAAVPAPGEGRDGAYLSRAREDNPGMCVVVMLSDPIASAAGAPVQAVQLVKPFSVVELERSIALAHVRAKLTLFMVPEVR